MLSRVESFCTVQLVLSRISWVESSLRILVTVTLFTVNLSFVRLSRQTKCRIVSITRVFSTRKPPTLKELQEIRKLQGSSRTKEDKGTDKENMIEEKPGQEEREGFKSAKKNPNSGYVNGLTVEISGTESLIAMTTQ